MKQTIYKVFFIWIAVMTTSCASNDIQMYSEQQPLMDVREYFDGNIEGWGFVQDWRGKVVRRFDIDMKGSWQGDTGTLEESFRYYDGVTQERRWTLTRVDESNFVGAASDVESFNFGRMSGNMMHMSYQLEVPYKEGSISLKLDDRLWLFNDGVVINKTKMTKFGLPVGSLTVFMKKIES